MKLIKSIIKNIPSGCFTDTELKVLIRGSNEKRYNLVKNEMAKKDIIRLRRGLYCLAQPFQKTLPNLFSIAQMVYGPSYISIESALSYHQWIPEAVPVICSVSAKRSKEFHTPLGNFIYFHAPYQSALTGVERIETEGGPFLMASPWKAVLDYIYIFKKNWIDIEPLIESLRIDDELLMNPPLELLSELDSLYQNRRISKFVKSLQRNHPR